MEILGIKCLELKITDPMGNQETFMILPSVKYHKAVMDLSNKVDKFLKDYDNFNKSWQTERGEK